MTKEHNDTTTVRLYVEYHYYVDSFNAPIDGFVTQQHVDYDWSTKHLIFDCKQTAIEWLKKCKLKKFTDSKGKIIYHNPRANICDDNQYSTPAITIVKNTDSTSGEVFTINTINKLKNHIAGVC